MGHTKAYKMGGTTAARKGRNLPAVLLKRNREGMSLVELLVAMTILLFVFLALMQTAIVTIDSNMINLLREEGIRLGELAMNNTRGLALTNSTKFDALKHEVEVGTTTKYYAGTDPGTREAIFNVIPAVPIEREIRNTKVPYKVIRRVEKLGEENLRVTVEVRWIWKEKGDMNSIPDSEIPSENTTNPTYQGLLDKYYKHSMVTILRRPSL